MDIEGSNQCSFDYVQLYDGDDAGKKVLGKFCGRNLPPVITSTANEIYIHFKSDDRDTRQGFKLTWQAVDRVTTTTTTTTTVIPEGRFSFPFETKLDFLLLFV